jgi:hypothetical protein
VPEELTQVRSWERSFEGRNFRHTMEVDAEFNERQFAAHANRPR